MPTSLRRPSSSTARDGRGAATFSNGPSRAPTGWDEVDGRWSGRKALLTAGDPSVPTSELLASCVRLRRVERGRWARRRAWNILSSRASLTEDPIDGTRGSRTTRSLPPRRVRRRLFAGTRELRRKGKRTHLAFPQAREPSRTRRTNKNKPWAEHEEKESRRLGVGQKSKEEAPASGEARWRGLNPATPMPTVSTTAPARVHAGAPTAASSLPSLRSASSLPPGMVESLPTVAVFALLVAAVPGERPGMSIGCTLDAGRTGGTVLTQPIAVRRSCSRRRTPWVSGRAGAPCCRLSPSHGAGGLGTGRQWARRGPRRCARGQRRARPLVPHSLLRGLGDGAASAAKSAAASAPPFGERTEESAH